VAWTQRHSAWCWWLALVLLWSGPVLGQASADRAAAEALFRDAGRLYRAGDFQQACRKLAKSQRLDPAVGTLLNLGRCYEKLGRTAIAWLAYEDAAAIARQEGQAQRQQAARAAAERLSPALSRLTLQIAPSAQLERLSVVRDGHEVARAAWNAPVPVDPGTYLLEARAPDHRAWRSEVTIQPSEQLTVEVPILEALPTSAVTQSTPVEPGPPPMQDAPAARLVGQRVAGLISAGVGALSLGVGGLVGLSARSDKQRVGDRCEGDFCSDPQATRLNNSALSKANASSLLVGLGALAVVGGAVLWWTGPDGQEAGLGLGVSPSIYAGGAGVSLSLQWTSGGAL